MTTLLRALVVILTASAGLFMLRQVAAANVTSWELDWSWLTALINGEWGRSSGTGELVSEALMRRLPLTVGLTLLTLVLGNLIAGCIAFWQVRKSRPSAWLIILVGWLQAVPGFVAALISITLFSLHLNWLPGIVFRVLPTGLLEWPTVFALPVGVLLIVYIADNLGRLTVALSTTPGPRAEYISLRYILVQTFSVATSRTPYLLASVLVVELVFAVPGVARMLQLGLYFGDLPFLFGSVAALIVSTEFVRLACRGVATVLMSGQQRIAQQLQPPLDLRLGTKRGMATELVGLYALPVAWIVVVSTLAVLALVGVPNDPNATDIALPFARPSSAHWFGTDALGRDQFALLANGAAPMLIVATLAASVLTMLVHAAHVVLQYAPHLIRPIRPLVNLIIDVCAAMPIIVVLLMAAYWYGPRWEIFAVALVVGLLPDMRAQIATSPRWTWATALALFSMLQAAAMGWLSAAGFLGFGWRLNSADWGAMIAVGREHLAYAPQVSLLPALALCITIWAWLSIAATLRAHDQTLYTKTDLSL